MAPEQLKGHATTKSDLFSLGMVLLTLITQKPVENLPTDGKTGKIRVNLLRNFPSKGVKKVISKLVEPGSGKRFQNPDEALKMLVQHEGVMINHTLQLHRLPSNEINIEWLKIKRGKHSFFDYEHTVLLPLLGTLVGSTLYSILFDFSGKSLKNILGFAIGTLMFSAFLFNLIRKENVVKMYPPKTNHHTLLITSHKTQLRINGNPIRSWDQPPEIQIDQQRSDRIAINLVYGEHSFSIKFTENLESAVAFKKKLTGHIQELFST